jgi:hypothetical protein
MEQIIYASIVSLIYVFSRSVYSKYSPDDTVPLKQLIKDGVIVFVSAMIGSYISTYGASCEDIKKNISVLTSQPEF